MTERVENELCCIYLWALFILQPFHHFTYVINHSPILPLLYLRHSSFSNPSSASPTSQFILQSFFCFSYITSSSLNSPGEPPMELGSHTISFENYFHLYMMGGEGWLGFPDLWSGQKPEGTPEGPISQIHSPHLYVGAPGIFSDLLRSVQVLKREWGAESNGKLPHLSFPSKTATLVPEFAMEDLPLDRTAILVPAFAVKDLVLGTPLWWWFQAWWLWSVTAWKSNSSVSSPIGTG